MLNILYRLVRKLCRVFGRLYCHLITYMLFKFNNIQFTNFRTRGIPYFNIYNGGRLSIGSNFAMNNRLYGNVIASSMPCVFAASRGSTITIGDNVGLSQTVLIAHENITIGNNVKIGAGTCIYTSDFHCLDYSIRRTCDDSNNIKSSPVIIQNDVFIGAKCIILKGVSIGEHSVIGAGSVVSKSIPSNQIWAGNPAKFIRNL